MTLLLALTYQVEAKRTLGNFANATHAKPQLIPTNLKILVVDELGNLVEGAQVAIYIKREDYLKSINSYQSGKTNEKGSIKFSKIKPVSYFIEISKGEKKNDGLAAHTQALTKGKTNYFTILIQ